VGNNGFDLSSAADGVDFNILAEAAAVQRISWTSAGSSNALLALDRNGNSMIDNGQELFGDITPQPTSDEPHGFKALAVYDEFAEGGNGNGSIDAGDAIYPQLQPWQDTNHNGVSESYELYHLDELGVAMISLDYQLSHRVDQHGNQFRYRAKIKNAKGEQNGRWAWDVFLNLQQ
jgi:hypothetical protein